MTILLGDTGLSVADALLAVHRSYYPTRHAGARSGCTGWPTSPAAAFPAIWCGYCPRTCEAVVDPGTWEWPPLFRFLQQAGGVSTEEMRDVFNLGVGLIARAAAGGGARGPGRGAGADGVATWAMGEIRPGQPDGPLRRPWRRRCMRRLTAVMWPSWPRWSAAHIAALAQTDQCSGLTPGEPTERLPRRGRCHARLSPCRWPADQRRQPGPRHRADRSAASGTYPDGPGQRSPGAAARPELRRQRRTVPPGDEVVAPAPLVEAALGLWKGWPWACCRRRAGVRPAPADHPGRQPDRSTPARAGIGSVALGLGYGARVGVLNGHSARCRRSR